MDVAAGTLCVPCTDYGSGRKTCLIVEPRMLLLADVNRFAMESQFFGYSCLKLLLRDGKTILIAPFYRRTSIMDDRRLSILTAWLNQKLARAPYKSCPRIGK
jgi:hypothetical protein